MTSVPKKIASSFYPWVGLLILTAIAVLIEGYHLGADDAEIYVAGVKRVFNPQLYPFGEEFFLAHAKLSLFSPLVGYTARLFHIPIDLHIFLWHIISIFLFLFSGWRIACLCFENPHARWAAVTLLACVLAVPATGTALVLMDPYVTARSLSTPATILTIAYFLEKRTSQAILWLVIAFVVHPQMAVYGVAFRFFSVLIEKPLRSGTLQPEKGFAAVAWLQDRLPKDFYFQPAKGAYHETLYMRTFFFVSQWAWFEWVGVVAPLAILYGFTRITWRSTLPTFQLICRTLVPFGICATIAAILLGSTSRLENFLRLQPMRSFHLLYVLFFLLIGGLIGEYFLQKRIWRWAALFLPLALGMFFLECTMYPASRHIEWPGKTDSNQWVAAFYWIRNNTPQDAGFAMDPAYMYLPGEDQHGFRAIAERSRLADYYKDSGVGSLFPDVAEDWKKQQIAMQGWSHFGVNDFKRLAQEYPIHWLVLERPAPTGLECPYSNSRVTVCKIPQ